MNRLFLFAVLFLISNTVQYSSCERFNIVPSPNSPCPGEFTGEPCLTLEQYVANPSLSSNITFELHPGNHRLDSQLSVSNINSFTMRANTSVTVSCIQHLRIPFYFNRLQQIHISGITLSLFLSLFYMYIQLLMVSHFFNICSNFFTPTAQLCLL